MTKFASKLCWYFRVSAKTLGMSRSAWLANSKVDDEIQASVTSRCAPSDVGSAGVGGSGPIVLLTILNRREWKGAPLRFSAPTAGSQPKYLCASAPQVACNLYCSLDKPNETLRQWPLQVSEMTTSQFCYTGSVNVHSSPP